MPPEDRRAHEQPVGADVDEARAPECALERGTGARHVLARGDEAERVGLPHERTRTGVERMHVLDHRVPEAAFQQTRAQGGRGHALECRVYAEDPARDYLPSIGKILLAVEPRGPGVRKSRHS